MTTSKANTKHVKRKKKVQLKYCRTTGQDCDCTWKMLFRYGGDLVHSLGWLVLCSCQIPSSGGFRLGSLKHRDLTLLIRYEKLALTWKGKKTKQMESQWMGL